MKLVSRYVTQNHHVIFDLILHKQKIYVTPFFSENLQVAKENTKDNATADKRTANGQYPKRYSSNK